VRLKYLYLVKVGLVATVNLCIAAVGLHMCISNPLKLDIAKTSSSSFSVHTDCESRFFSPIGGHMATKRNQVRTPFVYHKEMKKLVLCFCFVLKPHSLLVPLGVSA
jgi:hypothetical protein